MSAIAGLYYLDNRWVDRTDLERMLSRIAHRGPDGAATWNDGPVGFGHRMLWTTPESCHERLPLVHKAGCLSLTADARIDNRDELFSTLGLLDCSRREMTDSQLILAAYEKWGASCPAKLLGDFAFAIWDGRNQLLFCARDHFGVKPFYYYYRDGHAFAFASEIKALLSLSDIPRRLNEVRVADYLVSQFDDTAITFCQDILRLPPAHSMTISSNGMRLQSYWRLDPGRELRLGSDEAYAEAFRERFIEAVNCRLRSAFPVGTLLSGGLDSSSITCVAQGLLSQNGGSRLHTFSAVFEEVSECDERFFINTVLAQKCLEPHYIYGDQLSPWTDLDRMLWHQDEALEAPNLFLNWALYHAAKEQRVRVLLDGFDGDTTVSHGAGYLHELAQTGQWITLVTEMRGYAQNFDLSFRRLLWSYVWRYGLDPIISNSRVMTRGRRMWWALLRRVMSSRHRESNRMTWSAILNPDFVRRIDLIERRKVLRKDRLKPPQTEREHHYNTLTWGVMPLTLEILDRAAAAFGIEPRFPFWDKRLVEFCLALPPEQKMYRGWTRMVLRHAMDGILPKEVQWRGSKSNLAPSFDHGLFVYERERLDEAILRNPGAIEKYVDIPTLRVLYSRFTASEAMSEATDEVLTLWKAVSLALWLRCTDLEP